MATEIKSARDALEKIEKLAHCDLCNVYPKYRAKFDAKIGGIERIAKAALAAPPRNCDKADKWLDLYCHFHPPKGMREMPPEWVDAISAFCRWVVAPAQEEEGGGDVGK